MNEAKFYGTVMVADFDTGDDVELSIFKHDGGGLFAIDSSFIYQGLGDEYGDDEDIIINDPFEECDENRFATVRLIGL